VTAAREPGPRDRPDWRERIVGWGKRIVLVLVAVAIILLIALAGAAFLPRWWAHRIGAQASGSFTGGIALGLFYGFVFVALALLALRWTFRKRRAWRVWAGGVIAALVLATPNLLTLGIVVGRGNAAHAGERTLDVEAPGFRTATLAGAIAALVALIAVEYLIRSRRRARSRLARLKSENRRREQVQASREQPPG